MPSGDLLPGLQERCGGGIVASSGGGLNGFCHCQREQESTRHAGMGDGQWGGLGTGRESQ